MAETNSPSGRDSPPRFAQKAWNLAEAVAAFVADGLKTVTPEQYQERLSICDGCDRRRDNVCLECGCRLSVKARGRAFQCPLGKWPPV